MRSGERLSRYYFRLLTRFSPFPRFAMAYEPGLSRYLRVFASRTMAGQCYSGRYMLFGIISTDTLLIQGTNKQISVHSGLSFRSSPLSLILRTGCVQGYPLPGLLHIGGVDVDRNANCGKVHCHHYETRRDALYTAGAMAYVRLLRLHKGVRCLFFNMTSPCLRVFRYSRIKVLGKWRG